MLIVDIGWAGLMKKLVDIDNECPVIIFKWFA